VFPTINGAYWKIPEMNEGRCCSNGNVYVLALWKSMFNNSNGRFKKRLMQTLLIYFNVLNVEDPVSQLEINRNTIL
jgi:hypothetical protein